MATVKLYRNDSERIRVSKRLTELGTITGTFRNAVDIIRPIVAVDGPFSNQCNYFYIEEFGRYYFVITPIIPRNGIIELHGEVDVLQSWGPGIRRNSGIVERQEISYNLYLPDNLVHTYQNDMIGTKTFPFGFQSKEYVLSVVAV